MITVYVQIGMCAHLWTTFGTWNQPQQEMCQRLSNRMKSEVRAMRGEKCVATFYPHRVECSEGC